jgi:hypothetical protein
MNYTYVRYGDHLPMVGVLQLLLNRTGLSLVPDGVFGGQTLAAVKSFQKLRGLVPDGAVGENTWGSLTDGVCLPIVDCVDVWDPRLLSGDVRYLREVGGDPLVIGGMCNGVEQVVALLAHRKNVFLLRFHGHGDRGWAGVSVGQAELDPHSKEHSDIWANPKIKPVIMKILGQLRWIFGLYGCVEFLGCETGRGKQGYQFLSQLANELHVPVIAGKHDQYFGRLQTFRVFGPTATAFPGGMNLRDWCKSRPPFAAKAEKEWHPRSVLGELKAA